MLRDLFISRVGDDSDSDDDNNDDDDYDHHHNDNDNDNDNDWNYNDFGDNGGMRKFLWRLDAPVLQSFTLRHLSLGQTGHIVNLTELILDHDLRGSPPSMTDFLDLLESNTNLRRISLEAAGPTRNDGDPHRIVRLNCLEFLKLENAETKEILNHLSLPATVDIIIQSIYRMDGGILPSALTHLPSTEGFSVIYIDNDSRPGTKLSAYRLANTGSLLIDVISPTLYVYSFHGLPVAHVRTLWLEYIRFERAANGVIDRYPQSFFSSLPDLDTLVLLRCHVGSIFRLLLRRDGHMPCPSLTSLVIYEPFDDRIDFSLLSDLVVMRESRGAPFKNISILNYKGGLLGVERLPKCVKLERGGSKPEFPFKPLCF
jgi:hypothetical protein